MNNSLDADIYVEQKSNPEVIPNLEYTGNGNLKHNYYCEYIYCDNRYCKLVPFQKGKDWNYWIRLCRTAFRSSLCKKVSCNRSRY